MKKSPSLALTASPSPAAGLAAGAALGLVLTAATQSVAAGATAAPDTHVAGRSEYRAPRAAQAPVIDGVADDAAWATAAWHEIDQLWLGPEYSSADYHGRFKVVWTPERLYFLVEITDDILFDSHRDPLVQYWDDDCVEIFLDEDFSGGEHQYNFNAFTYHVSLDNEAIDIGTDRKPHNYSDHVESRWKAHGDTVVWEMAVKVYPDSYQDGSPDNKPVALSAGKVMGLMLAYCDNDGSEIRENFVGSESVPSGPKDRGWIDADIFGKLVLEVSP
jgi:hypothetical protein